MRAGDRPIARVAVAVVAVLFGCGGCRPTVVATPAGIEDCATREAYCVRVSCRVHNQGSAPESVMVRLETPIRGAGDHLSEHLTVSLGPSEPTTVRAEFTMGKVEPGLVRGYPEYIAILAVFHTRRNPQGARDPGLAPAQRVGRDRLIEGQHHDGLKRLAARALLLVRPG